MQQDGFIFFIFSEDKKPYFVGSNGLVQEGDVSTLLKPDGKLARLQYAPDGWKDSLVKYHRSPNYLGLIREFSVTMKFVKDGEKILKYLFYNKGTEAIAYLGIQKLNRLSYPTGYEIWYLGEFDFSKFSSVKDFVTINIMEGGPSKFLKANEATEYEIRIDNDPDRKNIYLDGLPFTSKIYYSVYNGQEILGFTDPTFYFLGLGKTSSTGHSQGVITQDEVFQPSSAFPNDNYFLWSVDKTLSVKIKGFITGICHAGSGGTLNIDIRRASDSTNTVLQTINLGVPGTYSNGDTWSISVDEVVTVNPHERLYIRIGAQGATNKFFVYGAALTVEYDTTFTPSYAEGLTPMDLFKRLGDKLFEGKYGVKSDFITSLSDLIITSGTGLREESIETSIKTSMTDFFQAMKTRGKKQLGIGMAIENDKLIMEELDYFFRDDVTMDLGIVDDLKVGPAEDLGANTIKAGYKDQTIDDVNGRDEVNVTQSYTTPIKRIVRELNLVSPYRADPYGIESVRTDQFGQSSTSSTADNETFILSVEKQPTVDVLYYSGSFQTEINLGQYYIKIPAVLGQISNGLQIVIAGSTSNDGVYTVENTSYLVVGFTIIRVSQGVTNENITGTLTSRNNTLYNLLRPAYTSITGVDHPDEIFNVELSPKRCLLNYGGYIRDVMDKQDFNSLKFQLGVRNVELSTTLAGVTITEKDDVPIGSLPDRLFLPYYFKFTTRVPIEFNELMKSNPYGRIKFTDGETGEVLYGYMWDGGIKPEPEDKQEWKLLSAPNNDLTKLI